MHLLSPAKNCCQECAVKHPATEPHNAQSLFYAFKFYAQHKRSPTWADAMSHCSDEVKAKWRRYLENLGININSVNKTGDIRDKQDLNQRLKKFNF